MSPTETMLTIRYYDTIRISAGEGSMDFEDDPVYEPVLCSKEYLKGLGISSGKDAVMVSVSGDSMSPVYKDGERVIVNVKQSEIENGKSYVVMVNGEFLLKHVKRSGGALELVSENESYQSQVVKEPDTFRVIGQVVGVWDEG